MVYTLTPHQGIQGTCGSAQVNSYYSNLMQLFLIGWFHFVFEEFGQAVRCHGTACRWQLGAEGTL